MGKIQDFPCAPDGAGDIGREAVHRLHLALPDIHRKAEPMALAAQACKDDKGAEFCVLPFCHTVEAEAMGGLICYGDEIAGPRGREYVCHTLEELSDLPAIDFEKGRIHEVLLACRLLKEEKERVVLQISGPFTILNLLIDAGIVYRAMRKRPEFMKEVFGKVGNEILRFMEAARSCGVDIISYADSAGGVNILGPKLAEQIVKDFTYGFLKQAESRLEKKVLVHLCPKTVYALIGAGYARYEEIRLPALERDTGSTLMYASQAGELCPGRGAGESAVWPSGHFVKYGEACVEMIGKVQFAGQMCIKHAEHKLENGRFQAVKLY